ncbi:unnamed protein product [Cuscuta epithymum]|uniref:Uncharacterized protein n=1 Tax=Cuscuta epithymum TaxID=186058 RepID=A0AAV0GCC1_9ASTE|nr:unnamed protein product [Cuscuta epithymum]
MKQHFIQLSLLLLLALSSLASGTETSPDYFFIIFQWPATKCDSKAGGCCLPKKGKPVLNDFIISEFQPFYAQDGVIPTNCTTKSKFEPSKIADLVPSLERNWPSLSCPSRDSKKLWKEEWLEYGTCSESVLNQHDYFAAALKAQKQINLLEIFADAGIKPNGTYYPGQAINKAVKKAGLNEALVECRNDENGVNAVLDKVTLCATTKGGKKPCPGMFWICDSTNGNAVQFLPPSLPTSL